MKKHIFLISIFFLINSDLIKAQRYLPGQAGLQLSLGGVDRFRLFKKNKDSTLNLFEYHIYSALSWYTQERNRWGFEFQFMRRKPEEKNKNLSFYSIDQYVGDVFYWIRFFGNNRKNFFLSLGFGPNFGYEYSTKNMLNELNFSDFTKRETEKIEKEKKQNKEANINGRILYGAFVGLEAEVFISNQFILLLNTKARYLRKSFIKDFQLNYGIGFKYILNY